MSRMPKRVNIVTSRQLKISFMNTFNDFEEFGIERLDLVRGGNVPPTKTEEVTCTPSGNNPNDPD